MTVARPGGGVKRPGGGVKTADDGDLLDGLDAAFSPERMGTYLQAAQGDREQALRLYTWNTAISAAFYGPLQALEIALRNAMHRELTVCYGEEWYDNPAAGLDRWARERIADARLTAQRTGHTATPSRVVATLAFGFWVALLSTGGRIERAGPKADYEKTLWRPALRGAFPHRATLTRRQAHKQLDALRALRNRCAHHEPVFARPLREDHDRILEVTGWISPHVRAWIERHSRVSRLLDAVDGVTGRPRSGNRVLGHPRGSDPGRSARNGTDRPSRGRSVGWSWRAGGVPGRCRRADGLGPEIARAVAAAVWLPGPRGCGRDRGRGRRRASRLIPARVPAPLPGRAASRRRWFRRRALCFGSRASGVSVRSAAVRAGARG